MDVKGLDSIRLIMTLDWHHLTRAVGKCAKVLYPAKKEKKQRTNWAKKIRRAFWRGKVDKALAELEQKRRHVRGPIKERHWMR